MNSSDVPMLTSRVRWWLRRLPLFNVVLLLSASVPLAKAYLFPEFGQPQSAGAVIAIRLAWIIGCLNLAYSFAALAELIIAGRFSGLASPRWLLFGLGTTMAVAVLVLNLSLTLTPF